MKLTRLTLFPLTIFFLFLSCARNPVTGKRDFMLMSESQEIAMGKQSDPEIKSFFGVYDDDQLQKFIQQKGKAMAAISHRPDLPYEFKVVDSPVVNAFAVPGGYIYFTRGIMAHFNNEAEFAGVLGHGDRPRHGPTLGQAVQQGHARRRWAWWPGWCCRPSFGSLPIWPIPA